MLSSSTGIIEVQGQKAVRKIYVACLEKYSYLCEVQALLPQKFNNNALRKNLSVTLLVCPTTNCEVQALVPQKFSNTAVRKNTCDILR